ncbi:MAG: hypothetical protein ACK4VY_11300 [Brevundimonas sp.]
MTAALALAVALAFAAQGSPAAAAAAQQEQGPAPRVDITLSSENPPDAERADWDLYQAAMTGFSERGFSAIDARAPALAEALARAPALYPMMSEVNGGWLIRTEDRDEAMTLARAIGVIEQGRGGGAVKIVVAPNTYPLLALLLGSAAIERRAFDEAHQYLDAGLALQPLHRLLLNEKLVALHGQQRWEDAYLLLKTALAADDPLLSASPAHLQRRLGYTLIELGRLREAREAYVASLTAEPGNAIALAELELIDDIEAGRATAGEMEITAPLAPQSDDGKPTGPLN